MPRDNMSSLIQRVARQALVTFTQAAAAAEASAAFWESHGRLRALLGEVRPVDLGIVPRSGTGAGAGGPPVTYMHICESDTFSMGVFLLRSGATIPLHDHPGMHGLLKVLYGTLRVTCFDRASHEAAGACQGPVRAVLRSAAHCTSENGACVLTPHTDNLHRIHAVDGPAAFLDILAPPYEPQEGRDCHYYKVLKPVPEPQEPGEVWLIEITQPPEFWCGGESYPGPRVKL